VAGARILLLGLTFKENCPDLRNTRVVELAGNSRITARSWISMTRGPIRARALQEYGIRLVEDPRRGRL
jgi:UDP-N-acetyl-D-galactosamine dehydrogenase